MTTIGWILMGLSWLAILSLAVFSFSRVLKDK